MRPVPRDDEPALQEVSFDPSARKRNARAHGSLVPGEKWHDVCPGVCGAPFDVTWTGSDFLVGSFSAKCPRAGECLHSLAAAAGTTAGHIKSNPLQHLAPWLDGGRRAVRHPVKPPSEATVAGWRSALLASPEALRYLIERRGLTLETIERYELGYDRDADAVTFSVRDEDGELVNVKRRFLNSSAQPKSMGLARPAALYPVRVLAGDPQALVVCEGEVDALLLNQHGISAVTSTAGTHWNPEWDAHVVGRQVAVLYDAGVVSYDNAEARAEGFRLAGARDAWPVDLTLAGFQKGEDVGDWFVKYGRSADELRRYIWSSRRWHRRNGSAS